MLTTTKLIGFNNASQPATMFETSVPEEADGPATNLFNPDRYTVWKCPITADPTLIMDFGGGKNIDAVGTLNFTPGLPDYPFPQRFQFWYRPTTYPDPANITSCILNGTTTITRAPGTSFVTLGVKVGMNVSGTGIQAGTKVLTVSSSSSSPSFTVNLAATAGTVTLSFTDRNFFGYVNFGPGRKDFILPITRTSVRYAEIIIESIFQPFSLGAFAFLTIGGGSAPDLGIGWSPGSAIISASPDLSFKTAGGNFRVIRYGRVTRSYEMVFNSVPDSIRDALLNVQAMSPTTNGRPILLDPLGGACQVLIRDINSESVWGAPNLWNVTVTMDELP